MITYSLDWLKQKIYFYFQVFDALENVINLSKKLNIYLFVVHFTIISKNLNYHRLNENDYAFEYSDSRCVTIHETMEIKIYSFFNLEWKVLPSILFQRNRCSSICTCIEYKYGTKLPFIHLYWWKHNFTIKELDQLCQMVQNPKFYQENFIASYLESEKCAFDNSFLPQLIIQTVKRVSHRCKLKIL